MKTILLGITGSIAAYKAAELANLLTKDGHSVEVVMTEAAMKFITPLTLQTLTKNRVYTDTFDEWRPSEVQHISLAKKTDLCIIAPASADIIGKIACGIADDMLTTTVMALKNVPVLIAPAMNTAMYENPIVLDNMEKLKRFGYIIIEPREALLACGDLGRGALAELNDIMCTIKEKLSE